MINKYLLIVIILVGAVGIIYGLKTMADAKDTEQIKTNQDYIIKSLNDSENARQAEKLAVLDTIKKDLAEKRQEHQQIIDNLTTVMKSLNLTVVVHDNEDSDNNNNNATGKISAFLSGPVEILNSTQ